MYQKACKTGRARTNDKQLCRVALADSDLIGGPSLQYVQKLEYFEKKIHDLGTVKKTEEDSLNSLKKSKEEIEQKLLQKSHSGKEIEQEKLLLLEINQSLTTKNIEYEHSKNDLERKLSEQTAILKELVQEKEILSQVTKYLKTSILEANKSKEEIEQKLSEKSHSDKEREQEKLLRFELNKALLSKIEDLQKSKDHLEKKMIDDSQSQKELVQQRFLLSEIATSERVKSRKLYKKYYLLIGLIAVIAASSFAIYSYYQNEILLKTTTQILTNMKDKHLIQNLRGDTVDTWISWRLNENRVVTIGIINTANVDAEKIEMIKNAVLSTESIELDDSLFHKGPKGTTSVYYEGWKGAVQSISEPTKFILPINLSVVEHSDTADITIELSRLKDADGVSGYTNSIADENQILKSKIIIYQADTLDDNSISAIVRHEFGHALGLGHSTAPEDLMAPTILTTSSYISQCDIDAIKKLYDGGQSSEVICQK